jgi:hypothetical protein
MGQITLSSNNSLYPIHKQNTNPNTVAARSTFNRFKNAAVSITMYPTNPKRGVEMPKTDETSPEMIASQLTVALMVQGVYAGFANCCQRR